MPRDGTTRSPGIRWYSIEGISPTSASPEASFAAQAEGTSRETSTPGGGSRRSPHVRGRAFRKSTTETRSKASGSLALRHQVQELPVRLRLLELLGQELHRLDGRER